MTNAERLNRVARGLLEDVDGELQRKNELMALRAHVSSDPAYLALVLDEVEDATIRERLRVALTESL